MLYRPKRVLESAETGFGVYLWRLPNGSYVMDSKQNYLNCPSRPNNPIVEAKMRKCAESLGITEGEPFWLPGFRRITDGEWEDQMAELQSGGIPDVVDVWRQS